MQKNEVLNYLETLDSEQLKAIKIQISEMQANQCFNNSNKSHQTDLSTCPHCHGKHVIKRGHNKKTKRQMYMCKDCRKQFTESYNTMLYSSKKKTSTWLIAIECVLNHDTLAVMAEKCGIYITTAFYWRHKILDRMNDLVNHSILKDEVEIDETLIPVAFEEKVKEAPKKRGISENKINIACGIDKHNHIRCVVSLRGRITSQALINIYQGYIEEGSKVISDSLRSYHQVMKKLCVKWEKIPSRKKEVNGYTLDKVNGLHSSIKHFLYSFRGVGAKYLQNYVSLFIYQWEHGTIASFDRALALFEELNWNYKCTRNSSYNPQNRKLFDILELS